MNGIIPFFVSPMGTSTKEAHLLTGSETNSSERSETGGRSEGRPGFVASRRMRQAGGSRC